ncbi:universal stress protein [Halorarius litoreus]|uniref:universal stress protein n=1 Tax=Halorarius litoreus TaxID=2962676 RepID=UPI0020CCC8F0|nr:universal stress protein [Halorarius litoreus]
MYHVAMGIGPDDEQAAAKADAVIDLPQAPDAVVVTVVHASDDPDLDPTSVPAVASVLDRLRTAGVDVVAVVVDADPSQAVLDVADDADVDCICVGGRRRSPAGKLQLKNGAQQVILGTDRPALVVGQTD